MKKRMYLPAVCLIVTGLTACNPATPNIPATLIPGAAYTEGAATLVAGLTQTARVQQPEPSATPTLEPTRPPDTPTPLGTLLLMEATHTPTGSPGPTKTSASTARPGASATQRITAAATWPASYVDDFEEKRGWAEFSEPGFEAGYRFGHYRIYVGIVTGDSPVFSIRQQEYRDLSVQVDIVRREGPSNGYFGVLCRFIDTENYYRFVMSEGGDYSIGVKHNGEFTILASGLDGNIFKNEQDNTIRADCQGNRLALSINDKAVLETTDDSIQTGFIGLAAGTPSEAGLVVYFDTFMVRKP
jgi:hypothetical protein